MTDAKIVTTTTVKKELTLEEDELENILQNFGAKVLGTSPESVQVHIEVSSGGFVRQVVLSTESEKTE